MPGIRFANLILHTELRWHNGPPRGREGRRGDTGLRPVPPRRTGPRDLRLASGFRGGPRRTRRFDPAVPTAGDPRAAGEEARPRGGRERHHPGGRQTRGFEEPPPPTGGRGTGHPAARGTPDSRVAPEGAL